jgi:AraC family transcriptional regulator of adaptative response / DNA-3-methyladenine glycosylase II
VFASDAPGGARPGPRLATGTHLDVEVSLALLPSLMPLLARLRQLFDLDAEPSVIDAQLEQGGLAAQVARRRGLRVPGALEPFEIVLGALLRGSSSRPRRNLLRRVVHDLGEPLDTGVPGLDRLAPSAERVAAAGPARLVALGVPPRRAVALVAAARAMVEGRLSLDTGGDVPAAHRALLAIDGISDRVATRIVMRALYWPDAFAATDRALQRAAGASGPGTLRRLAERWRPWRAYAALHLSLGGSAAESGEPTRA